MSEREMFKAHFMAEGFDERNFERYDIHDPEDEASYRNTQIELMWQGWHDRAAIASASQQAAQPKTAMTDEQRHGLRNCINGGTQMGWISDDDARAILAAAGVSLETK